MMKKKLLSFIFLLFVGFSSVQSQVWVAAPTGQLLYCIPYDGGLVPGLVVMWGNNASGNLVIPSQAIADYYGEPRLMNMVGILSSAFYQDTGLTSLTVPNTVHYIESGAFLFCRTRSSFR